jgi:ATP-dependent helicase/nuclease subunit A
MTKPTPTSDQRQAADPSQSVWVAASAGSGKTHVLVDRITRLLLDGARPDTLLCLTFTKAAAGEMENRLFQRLGEWAGLSDVDMREALLRLGEKDVSPARRAAARKLFAKALETPGGLKIQTIHAFCEQLLQRFPVESEMAPGFRVMEEQEDKDLFRSSLLESLVPDDAFSRDAWSFTDDGEVLTLDRLEKLAKRFLSGSTGMRGRLQNLNRLAETEKNIRHHLDVVDVRPRVDIVGELVGFDRAKLRKAYDALLPHEGWTDRGVFVHLKNVLDAEADLDTLHALRSFLFTGAGQERSKILKATAQRQEPQLTEWFEGERKRLAGIGAELSLSDLLAANLSINKAMAGLLQRVNLSKRAQARYDFDDLISRAARLLSSKESAQWVLYKLDRGIQHILVDEAQDTSPSQWLIIKALADAFFDGEDQSRTLFVVGDGKQSIYSFQGADVEAFSRSQSHFKNQLAGVDRSLQNTKLTISYRSNSVVLDAVNAVFKEGSEPAQLMGQSARGAGDHSAHFRDRAGLVELWDLEMPDEGDAPDHWQAPVDKPPRNHPRRKLARRIATTIKSWIGKRQLTGRDRVVQAGDILILLQRRNSFFYALLGELGSLGIAVAGADRLKLQDSLIVQDLLAVAQFIRMPGDDLNLASLVKSPLMPEALTDDALYRISYGRKSSLWSCMPEASANFRFLQDVSQTQATPFMLFSKVLQSARTRIQSRLGDEAIDAAHEFLSLALDYEQQSGTSLSGFTDWFMSGETEIRREMEQGGQALRVMTVHGSKGLEAPIVFLADANDVPRARGEGFVRVAGEETEDDMLLFTPKTMMMPEKIQKLKDVQKKRDTAERMRLLYVGMTRAADELYICGVGRPPRKDGGDAEMSESVWYPHVKAAFEKDARRLLTDERFGVWRFGSDPVFDMTAQTPHAAKPILEAWVTAPIPKAFAIPAVTASRRSQMFDRVAVARGLNTHKLAEVMADTDMAHRLEVGLRWAKRLKLEEAVVLRLVDAFARADLAPLFSDLADSEVSIEGQVDGQPVSGRMDRMAVMADMIYLLDYKTDRVPPDRLDPGHGYVRQMATYKALLSQAYPDRPVKAALLWTETGDVQWLDQFL